MFFTSKLTVQPAAFIHRAVVNGLAIIAMKMHMCLSGL